MIVVSLPRCGATKFCLDLSNKTNFPFIGELHPIHIGSDRKAKVHETGFQPVFTPSNFADILNDHSRVIVLANQHSYLMLPKADFVILRRNMVDAATSYANFLIKMYPSIDGREIIHHLRLMRYDLIAINGYTDKYPTNIIWYEDYYGKQGTSSNDLQQHKHYNVIAREIQTLYGSEI